VLAKFLRQIHISTSSLSQTLQHAAEVLSSPAAGVTTRMFSCSRQLVSHDWQNVLHVEQQIVRVGSRPKLLLNLCDVQGKAIEKE
jgi:hypothetical protein